jgi:hypothetical protein
MIIAGDKSSERADRNQRVTRLAKVFITVDTEVWPEAQGWPHTPLAEGNDCARELSWYFYGGAGSNPRGLPYQLRTLASAGLKATFFVDPLFSFALGAAPLRELVELIQQSGQEIGLHLHPEWLTDPRCKGLPAFSGPLLHRYSEPDQARLIQAGLARLRELGARQPRAFRAGNWGATLATLRALGRSGIAFDSSLNACFASSFPDLDAAVRGAYTQPAKLEGVWEFPVTSFIDRPPRGRRPLHVCATSLGEFRAVLEHAAARQWFAVVIVLHSFEFVRIARLSAGTSAPPQRLLADRFERLCAYLADNGNKHQTCHFTDLDEDALPRAAQPLVPTSSLTRTALRQIEQLASRLY